MTELTDKVTELHTKRSSLETSARAHEVAARVDRAEIDEIKTQLTELGQAVAVNTALQNLQKTQQAADTAHALVQDRAKDVTNMLDEMRMLMDSLKVEFDKLKAEKATE